jgi:O-antigen/teichoic acid export membrane protein
VAAGIPLLLQVLDFAFSLGGVASEPLALKYPEVHILLLIGGIAMPVHAVEIVAGQYAIAEGYKNAPLKVQFVSLVAIVAILFPLSAYFGLYGVLIAAGLGEAAKAFAYVAILWKPFRRNMKSTLVYTVWSSLCTFAGAFPVFYYRHWKYNWVIAFPAMIAFFVGMVIFRLAHREDFKRAWRAFRTRGAPEREEGFENAPEGFDRTLEALQVDKIREAIEAQRRQR